MIVPHTAGATKSLLLVRIRDKFRLKKYNNKKDRLCRLGSLRNEDRRAARLRDFPAERPVGGCAYASTWASRSCLIIRCYWVWFLAACGLKNSTLRLLRAMVSFTPSSRSASSLGGGRMWGTARYPSKIHTCIWFSRSWIAFPLRKDPAPKIQMTPPRITC